MAGTGPAPNPQSRRQTGSQAHTWTDLPERGYAGVIPEWPLRDLDDEGFSAVREREVWDEIWRTPQAQAWALLGWVREVALYVRASMLAEHDPKLMPEARLRSVELGLTPTGMLKNRWRIQRDEMAEQRQKRERPRLVVPDAVEAP